MLDMQFPRIYLRHEQLLHKYSLKPAYALCIVCNTYRQDGTETPPQSNRRFKQVPKPKD